MNELALSGAPCMLVTNIFNRSIALFSGFALLFVLARRFVAVVYSISVALIEAMA